jgi:glycolate oxidase FAD binding subunit
LITGSWGTLGIVTEVTLRLYSRHSRTVTLAINLPANLAALAQTIRAVQSAPVVPFACELVSATMAASIGLPVREAMLIQLGGNSAAIEAQRRTLGELGATEVSGDVWERLRVAEDKVRSASAVASVRARRSIATGGDTESGSHAPAVLRISSLPSLVAKTWTAADAAMSGIDGALMHSTPLLGIVRCIIPQEVAPEIIPRVMAAVAGATIVFERLPGDAWQSLSPSVIEDRLSQRTRHAFDPHGILNPGILGPVS